MHAAAIAGCVCVCVGLHVTDGELWIADRACMLRGCQTIFGNLEPLLFKGAFISNRY